MTYKEEFITFMVRSGVLTFGDFTTKSGRKTPYFVNTGNYKTGAQAAKLGDYYAACIQEHMPDGITCLFGPAYKGIPLAVSAAASLYRNYDRDLPYCFNRKEAKDHGEGGSMVGYKPQVRPSSPRTRRRSWWARARGSPPKRWREPVTSSQLSSMPKGSTRSVYS